MATGGLKVVVSAIAGNGFITIIKFIGWFVSQSPSLLAEAVHSLADTTNQILLLIGMKQSNSPASRELPTGSGNARYMWNLISAVGIFFLGFGITTYHGIHSLIHYKPGPVEINWIAILVLVIAFAIELYVLIAAYKEVESQRNGRTYFQFFQDSDDPTVLAVLLEDGIAVIGVVLAFIGIVLGVIFQNSMFDIIAALIIGLLLGLLAVFLGIMNAKLLVGKSVNIHKEDEIKDFIESFSEIQEVTKLSTKILGAGQVRLSLEVELNGDKLINTQQLVEDVVKLKNGEDPSKVIHKSNERMVRLMGRFVNDFEVKIHERFPEVHIIDFEVN